MRARLSDSPFFERTSQIRNSSKSLDRFAIASHSLSKTFWKPLSMRLSLYTGLCSASLCSLCSDHRIIGSTLVYTYIYMYVLVRPLRSPSSVRLARSARFGCGARPARPACADRSAAPAAPSSLDGSRPKLKNLLFCMFESSSK